MITSEQEEIGLFTFYFQQTNDQTPLIQPSLTKLTSTDKDSKQYGHSFTQRARKPRKQGKNHNEDNSKDINLKLQEPDKIIQLLQKHKYIQRNHRNIKVVLKQQSETTNHANANHLKARLKQLMGNNQKQGQTVRESKRIQKEDSRQELKINYKSENNPFSKVALQPTNFDNSIDDLFIGSAQNSKSKIIFLKNNYKKQIKPVIYKQASNDEHLPKIQQKSSQEIMQILSAQVNDMIKLKVSKTIKWRNPLKQKKQEYLQPIKNDRYCSEQDSLQISAIHQNNKPLLFTSRQYQNQRRERHQQHQSNQQLAEIVKKMKFK